jgi:hypothetical protein
MIIPSSLTAATRALACCGTLCLAVAVSGCASPGGSGMQPDESASAGADTGASADLLTAAERAEGWRMLFDGRSTAGWRGYKQQSMPDGWQVIDGELTRVSGGGDIITTEQFSDFELALEWKVGPAGNSGVFYRVTEEGEESYHTGIEMQVLDDAGHADGQSRLTSAGSLYGLYPAPAGVVKPAGQWNSARVVVRGNHVEHWLNGQQVVEAELWSPDWNTRLAASKFTEWPGYARATRGHIGLQDHGDRVSFRNIKVRVLQ